RLVPGGGRSGGRVRPDRRRASRSARVGLDQLPEQLPARAGGLRQGLPGDGRGMSPDEKGGGTDQGDEQPRADETQEYELGDDFREDTADEEADRDEVEEADLDDDEIEDEDLEEADYDQDDDEDL